MKIIFGTTNKRKQMDLQKLSHSLNLDFEILNMDDIGWNKGEIEENGQTIEENAFIKAKALYDFCHEKGLTGSISYLLSIYPEFSSRVEELGYSAKRK